ncbi:sm domain-containing protein [Trichonephila inaurata madagascariensis]|uniref:Sm domain-containing protein n=1 Tax=Trichonephila inaurata madagascariensis TaxID=2747483 RepID=A0A8X6X2A5_9ARAC|nr:sm domain-containing protein [Trichonephila inaurata madagascariensis]
MYNPRSASSSTNPKPEDSSVPVKLLMEFLNKKVTVDTSKGELFEGVLIGAEENMSLSLNTVKATFASGHTADMENVYIKGHKVRFVALPEESKEHVKNLQRAVMSARGGGRGGRGGRGGGRGGRGRGGFSRGGYSRGGYSSKGSSSYKSSSYSTFRSGR